MPADASSFVAGHYNITWNALALGTTEQGLTITPAYNKEEIRVDDFGDVVADGIYRGYNLRISFELLEWTKAGRQALQFPFDSTLGTLDGIGKTLAGSFAHPLICTPVSNINAANKIYTFPLTIPDGDHGAWNLNTKVRRVRCNLLVLPNLANGLLFTET